MQEALEQARANSPAYRQILNDAAPAKWGVRNAYGSFLPTVSVAGDLGYTGSGESNFGGGFVRPTSAFLTSGYSLGLNWQLDGRVLSGPGQQKALQQATDEDISGAGINLRADITTQYLNALQAAAQVDVARQQVVRNADFLHAGPGALPGRTGHAARRPSGRGDQGPVRRRPAPRDPAGERGEARAAPPHGRRAAGRHRADRRSAIRSR